MPEAETEFDRNVVFPNPISYEEVQGLFKYLIVHLDGNYEVRLRSDELNQFGGRFQDKPKTLDDVVVILKDRQLSGTVHKHPIGSVQFRVNYVYVDEEGENPDEDSFRIDYNAINFEFTPGCRIGTLASEDPSIVEDVRKKTEQYFAERPSAVDSQ